MCGIACLFDPENNYSMNDFNRFTDVVAHRGPDGRRTCYFQSSEGMARADGNDYVLAMGHRRLSILDLSDAGAQPMFSDDLSTVITYNGEIYNYIELGDELNEAGVEFHSECDTEVLLAAWRMWGEKCLERLNGMWAFAVLDRPNRKLFISRDRIGIKPLYYWQSGSTIVLASEIKQFLTLPGFNARPREESCVSYLMTGYESPPATFFEGIKAFPPGHFATIDLDDPKVEPQRFWFPEKIETIDASDGELTDAIRETFNEAVNLRLRSDVPLGGCLSGGLDSSAIFVNMKELEPEERFSAFSACFDQKDIDERPFIDRVVEKTDSRSRQVFPDENALVADFAHFLKQHDEPVGSISMYAQYQVMREARKNSVPVLLDGQGGDELFSGYWPAYMLFMNHLKNQGNYLGVFSNLLGASAPGGNSALIWSVFEHLREYRKRSKLQLPFQVKESLISKFGRPKWHQEAKRLTPEEYRLAEISRVHLPRLLKWEDRNSMAHSIESRVPFLDVNLVELALSIPAKLNMRNGWNKYLFRRSMSNVLPSEICWRKDKKGFETPQDIWMKRGAFHRELRDWSEKKEHPAEAYVETDFRELNVQIAAGNFDCSAMFRLYCLDKWLDSNF